MPSAVAESKSSYFFDKLHSLSGVVPIGAYLAEHFFENSYALVSPGKYDSMRGAIPGKHYWDESSLM
jgi:succinate dehydrogenase / fumarate reductase cytochrome b subunit